MRITLGFLAAAAGTALAALSLTGSTQAAATFQIATTAEDSILHTFAAGKRQLAAGNYLEAREIFLAAAADAQRYGALRQAAEAYGDAGAADVSRQDFRHALTEFLRARESAVAARDQGLIAVAINNLSSAYLNSGHAEAARQLVEQTLKTGSGKVDPGTEARLRLQLAGALSRLDRFPEALQLYRDSADALAGQGDFETSVRVLAMLGGAALAAKRPGDAEAALDEALWLSRTHHLPDSTNLLRYLARIRAIRGDPRSASLLFNAAVRAPALGNTPRWMVFADRGEFLSDRQDYSDALADFREARRLIALNREDVVPADRDRVAVESGLSRVPAGLADAANRLALTTGDRSYLEEGFDAAEQDRTWSLRALVPSGNDWRTRLPARYWDLLARYQAAERAFLARPTAGLREKAVAQGLELDHLEAAADPEGASARSPAGPALARVQHVLDPDTVLLSFLVTEKTGWVWAIDRTHASVFPVPALAALQREATAFSEALRQGNPDARRIGRALYEELFARAPRSLLAHRRWLVEPDGPLFDLPFAALIIADEGKTPVYLAERAAIETIPGALLWKPRQERNESAPGELLAIGDPVYNLADERFHGSVSGQDSAALPRLPATAAELRACVRAWGGGKARQLTGPEASLPAVEGAIAAHPSVIHFATHVVAGPDDFSSGLIALSLDGSGALGLLGPTEIVARPVSAELVVLNGCHSAQGKTLPSTGLMGLTRAWIGAGAGAVLATRWDIPDDAASALISAFYRELSSHWSQGPAFALQQAQRELLKDPSVRANPTFLASYFLLGRI